MPLHEPDPTYQRLSLRSIDLHSKTTRRSLKSQNLRDARRPLLRREEQLLLRFFSRGSRQLNLIWASLTLQGPECMDPTFSRSRIKRRGQREKDASSNRLPRFLIGACSALVLFEKGAVCEFPSR